MVHIPNLDPALKYTSDLRPTLHILRAEKGHWNNNCQTYILLRFLSLSFISTKTTSTHLASFSSDNQIRMNQIEGNICLSPEQLMGWFLTEEPNLRFISSALTNRCHCSQEKLTLRLSCCGQYSQIKVLKFSNSETHMWMFFFCLARTHMATKGCGGL